MASESVAVRDAAGPRASATTSPYRATLGLAALTCALAPAYVIRWHIWFYPTTLLEVMIGLTVLAFLVETWRSGEPLVWRSPYTYPGLLFLLAGMIGVAISPLHVEGAGLWRAYILEPLAFFFVLGAVVRSGRAAYLVLAGLGLGGLVAGLANSFVVVEAMRHHVLNVAVRPPVVIYNTANAVALYLVPLIAVAGAVVLHARDRRLRLGSLVFAALAVVSVLLSFSRGGYVALAAVGIGLALSHRWRWRLLPAVLVVGAVLTQVPPIEHRLAHEFNPSDPNNSFLQRLHLWEATLRMLRQHPVFGAGMSAFQQTIQPYIKGLLTDQQLVMYPHNLILNFWTETGLLGLAAFVWILVQAFRTSLQGWRRAAGSWRPLSLGVSLAMVAVIVHGMVDVPYWKNDLSLEFWSLLALTWASIRWGSAGRSSPSMPEATSSS
ncbi:MAG TPA: O-antigen ligase family protein [Candidatus Dormibacteraeota bacterium]|nr:O-antigen ligase family protein [Candidatus Dormibacteraeota bacterium]